MGSLRDWIDNILPEIERVGWEHYRDHSMERTVEGHYPGDDIYDFVLIIPRTSWRVLEDVSELPQLT